MILLSINPLIVSFSVLLSCIVAFLFTLKYLKKLAEKSGNSKLGKISSLISFPLLLFLIFLYTKLFFLPYLTENKIILWVTHLNSILVIISLIWLLFKLSRYLIYLLGERYDVHKPDNLNARRILTQLKILQQVINFIIVLVGVAAVLLSFEEVRKIGINILASAGVIGIIIGFAAQKSLALVLAGFQVAFTQPFRIDDVVIVENEWGRIEEITLTYVVIKIWDERRLIVPVTYFLEKPFQNWTRTSAEIIGTVYLYTDYSLPIDALRNELNRILKDHPRWDGRVASIQITNSRETYMEIRIIVSSSDSSANWDLRCDVREKMICFIQDNFPDCFAKFRFLLPESKS